MRREGISGWQSLFVYAGSALGRPTTFTRFRTSGDYFKRVIQKYRRALGPLVDTLTPARIRSTAGVVAYLRTHSLDEMARTLGNKRETSLRHYLPDVLWAFFQDRWLRIFQNLLIIQPVQGTTYALEVSDFSSWGEVDTFLDRNILRDVPEAPYGGLHQAPRLTRQRESGRILVVAAVETWTALYSLKAAVERAESKEAVQPKALYWARFADHLETHIRSKEYTNRGIKAVLAEAQARVRADRFRSLIYA